MWPWNRQARALELPAALEERLARVEKTQEDLASSSRKLRLEWEDVYDRIERIVARINARSRKERAEADAPPSGDHQPTEAEVNDAIRRGVFTVRR